MEYERIYQAINAVSERVNDLAHRMDEYCSKRVDEITPYTETQTAYYGESEKVFYNVPNGNISVFFNNYNGNYKINRISDRVLVTFDTLKDYTNIKIMVQ